MLKSEFKVDQTAKDKFSPNLDKNYVIGGNTIKEN